MIYPISQSNVYNNIYTTKLLKNEQKHSLCSFKSGNEPTTEKNKPVQTPTLEESMVMIKNSMDKITWVIAFGGIIGISAILALLTKNKNGTKQITKNIGITPFKSLEDDTKIPTVKTCKSLNKTLQNLLENQIAVAQANSSISNEVGEHNIKNRFILCGPPGTGKSFYAKVYAKSLGAEYKEIKFADFIGRYVEWQNENLKNEFETIISIAKAEPNKKFVVVFNEIDAILVPAEKMANSTGIFKQEERSIFLTYIDECTEKVPNLTIIGTSNLEANAEYLDGAALSRFKNIYEISYPEQECIYEAIKSHLLKIKNGEEFVNNNKEELIRLAKRMEDRRFSFRDLDSVISTSKDKFIRDKVVDNNTNFKIEYLINAEKELSKTDGELSKKLSK